MDRIEVRSNLSHNKIIISLLISIYLFCSLFINELGFFPLISLISIFFLIFFVNFALKVKFYFPAPLIFFFGYSGLIFISFRYWGAGYDIKDILGTYLFFILVPFFLVNLGRFYKKSFIPTLKKCISAFFYLLSGAILIYGLLYGVSWDRPFFFNNILFHKNGLAAIYEIFLIFNVFSVKGGEYKRMFLLLSLGLICLIIIGSKTAIVIVGLFSFGLFSKKIFYAGLVTIVILLAFVMTDNNNIEESLFKTANYRSLLWSQATSEITATSTTLFFGNGPGSFTSKINQYGLQDVDNTHNYLIQIGHNYGVLGLFIFSIFFLLLYFKIGFWKTPFSVAFWAFNVHSLFDVGWVKGPGFFASLILGGALSAITFRNNKLQKKHESLR